MTQSNHTLKLERTISASPEATFDAWLDEKNIATWMKPAETVNVPKPKIDARVGGSFDLTMDLGNKLIPHSGEYKKINRPHELQFTWKSPETHDLDTLVTITLEALSEGETKLTLIHELLPTE